MMVVEISPTFSSTTLINSGTCCFSLSYNVIELLIGVSPPTRFIRRVIRFRCQRIFTNRSRERIGSKRIHKQDNADSIQTHCEDTLAGYWDLHWLSQHCTQGQSFAQGFRCLHVDSIRMIGQTVRTPRRSATRVL